MTSKNYYKIITDIYLQYNPNKVSEVQNLIDKYNGSEEELLQSIINKYKIPENEINLILDNNKKDTNYTFGKTHYSSNYLIYSLLVVVLLLIIGYIMYQKYGIQRENDITTNTTDTAITKTINTQKSIPKIEIEEFEFDSLYEHFSNELATETTNFSLQNGNPNKIIFVEAGKSYMKINGVYEIFIVENHDVNDNGFESKYSNSKYKVLVTGKCIELKGAIIEGAVESTGQIKVMSKLNNETELVSFNGVGY